MDVQLPFSFSRNCPAVTSKNRVNEFRHCAGKDEETTYICPFPRMRFFPRPATRVDAPPLSNLRTSLGRGCVRTEKLSFTGFRSGEGRTGPGGEGEREDLRLPRRKENAGRFIQRRKLRGTSFLRPGPQLFASS